MIRLFYIALIYCGLVVPAYSWGPLGHRIVALIAENHLSESARIGVDELLALDGKTRMSQVASWADRNRSTVFFGQPMHMVRLPLDDSPYDPEKHCEGNRCVVAAIEAAVAVLKDPEALAEHRVVSLK